MLQSQHASGKQTAPTPCDANVVSFRSEINLAAGDLALNTIIEMGPLPANCELVDAILDSDDLDSDGAPAVKLDVGVMSGDFGVVDGTRTCGAELLSQSTVAQAGGVVRPATASAFRVGRSDKDRGIGIKVQTAPATAQAGKVGLTLVYRG